MLAEAAIKNQISKDSEADNKVLIVDEEQTNRRELSNIVTAMGFSPVFANAGIEALSQFRKLNPSLIIIDVMLANMQGIGIAAEIKAMNVNRFTPIIFVSQDSDPDIVLKAIDAGGDDFLQRPFPAKLLEGKIIALCRISDLYRQISQLNEIRHLETQSAEQLFSNVVEQGNVALDKIEIHKQPAEVFSGDVQLSAYRPNGEINVLLGDFTGHGLTSTFGALPLSETFRAMTDKGYEAKEILAQINRKLHKLLPTGLFLAAAIVTLRADGTVSIWNGGLPDVMIFRNGELIHSVPSGHLPLGILPSLKELSFETFKLEENDHILLISDGVLEANNEQGEMFGLGRCLQSIAENERMLQLSIIDCILCELNTFTWQHAQSDDISLIDIPGRIVSEISRHPLPPKLDKVAVALSHDVWNWSIELQGQSLNRINPVAEALSRLQGSEGRGERWNNIFTVLTELYNNALDHGVLELKSSLKEQPNGFQMYFSEREKRLKQLKSGSVTLQLQNTRLPEGGRLKVRIEDSGSGFDSANWLKKMNPDNLSLLSGRGLYLVSELCESIEFTNNGASVEVVCFYI
ncbi:MAG: fused response regulator/phosphatase [Pseudomonadales bacterium]|nr:fused response regulator/phosphatase [Pseudomonadales bacterium]NRA17051.1 fused response regulator/phosphatase [Oceanospirillaceae bacterium]